MFEDARQKPEAISARKLSELSREHAVPVVVLNACQSAMLDQGASDPFASVAAAPLKAGTRSVVAMSYAVTVSAAQKFLPPFYRELFGSGQIPEAARAGRQELFRDERRLGIHSDASLKDWMIPVVYQQESPDLAFAETAAAAAPKEDPFGDGDAAGAARAIPDAARLDTEPYRFVGRDAAFLDLERARRRQPAAVLVQGLGGVGKTILAKAWVQWLYDTGGLGAGCLWFAFNEIRSAGAVIHGIGQALARS